MITREIISPLSNITTMKVVNIGKPIEQQEVKIQMAYILRLKHYTEKVKNTAPNDIEHKMAVIALLGYLEALEILAPSVT